MELLERMERNGTLEQMEFLEQVERDGTSQTKMEPTEQMERVERMERMEFLEQVERARTSQVQCQMLPFSSSIFLAIPSQKLGGVVRKMWARSSPFTRLASDE